MTSWRRRVPRLLPGRGKDVDEANLQRFMGSLSDVLQAQESHPKDATEGSGPVPDGLDASQTDPSAARADLQWINHLLDSDPDNPHLWLKKALAFEKAMVDSLPRKARLERTLLCHQQCLRLDPTNWIHHYNYGATLRQLNRHEEALEYGQRAVSLEPLSREAQSLLIQTLVRLGRKSQAKEAFKAAVARGCDLDPKMIGRSAAAEKTDQEAQQASQEEGQRPAGDVIEIINEAADPELYVLQVEVDELMRLGLIRAAEDLCVHFEIIHGETINTQAYLHWLKLRSTKASTGNAARVIRCRSLLEFANKTFIWEYPQIVDQLFQTERNRRLTTPLDANHFDAETRLYFLRMSGPEFDRTEMHHQFELMPPDFLRVWSMTTLNFMVARRLGRPLLIAYAATTLADFHYRSGASNLAYIIYKIAASSAERAAREDDALPTHDRCDVSILERRRIGAAGCAALTHGRCASILMERDQLGAAIKHLEDALKLAGGIDPRHRFDLYEDLAKCYDRLADHERAKEYYRRAGAVEGISEELRRRAQHGVGGVELYAAGSVHANYGPPLVLEGLTPEKYEFNTPDGPVTVHATSKQELYDILLNIADPIYQIRRSLVAREGAYAYYQGYSDLMDAMVRVALRLKLAGNALTHLEVQKCVILNTRLKYLLRERPDNVPDKLWEDLQGLVAMHRQMVEGTSHPETGLEALPDFTFADVGNAIDSKLWEVSKVAGTGARRLRRKLGFGRFPRKIECADPEQTLILEFGPHTCFFVRPDEPQDPHAVELPEATGQQGERLTRELLDIVQECVHQFSQLPSLASATPPDRFGKFLSRLDEVFYWPIASRLAQLSVTNLCIIPHRGLHVLPFNLLGMSDRQGSLGSRFALSFAPSLMSLEDLRSPQGSRPERFVIVSDPVPQCRVEVCRNPSRNCFSMDGAARESDVLASRLQALGIETVHLRGEEATTENVARELRAADVVHFATHGFFGADHVENSGLLLARSDDATRGGGSGQYLLHNRRTTPDRSPSAVGEILTLDYLWKAIDMFGCKVLNVSACSAGMSEWSGGSDEFYGLGNGFLYAGAQNIVSNLWPVHDVASEIFNLFYYEELLAKRGHPIAALKTAISRLKESDVEGGTPFAHPLFWGGYRVIGLE